MGLKVKIKTKRFCVCLTLFTTCTFLSEVDGAPVGIEMAEYSLRGRHTSQSNAPDQGSSHGALCGTQGVSRGGPR